MRLICAFKAFFQTLTKKPPAGGDKVVAQDPSHLRLLTLLQHEGRLIDFLQEDISSYSDAQIGAAVRSIHLKCQRTLEEFVTLRPIFTESEGTRVTIAQGYDFSQIKLIGKVKGTPPYQGILRHKGWKAHKESLPSHLSLATRSVICPAEVEVIV